MRRRVFILSAFAAGFAGEIAFAKDFVDDVVDQLEKQGFTGIRIQRTLLGRIRITGRRQGGQREIILNPRTGEILRDLWQNSSGQSGGSSLIEKERDDDEDDEDDDDDDDGGSNSGSGNSGSGSSNSGSGSSNSGSGSGGGSHGGGGN